MLASIAHDTKHGYSGSLKFSAAAIWWLDYHPLSNRAEPEREDDEREEEGPPAPTEPAEPVITRDVNRYVTEAISYLRQALLAAETLERHLNASDRPQPDTSKTHQGRRSNSNPAKTEPPIRNS